MGHFVGRLGSTWLKKVRDRTNHAMHTENSGRETDHQELEPGCEGYTHVDYF